MCKRWSDKDLQFLKENYANQSNRKLAATLGRTYASIKCMGTTLRLKKDIVTYRNGDLSNLMSETNEAFYWLGFYVADGHISKAGQLTVSQCEKNKEQIIKLAKFLNTNYLIRPPVENNNFQSTQNSYIINLTDPIVGNKIRKIFAIDNKKTYTRINLDYLSNSDKATSFLLGLIDGDGCIRKRKLRIKIECHEVYYEVLQELASKVSALSGLKTIRKYTRPDTNKTYAIMEICKSKGIKLYKFATDNVLPINLNKWKEYDELESNDT